VTVDDVKRVFAKRIQPDRMVTVVVGATPERAAAAGGR
jgi:predicted Zn-dependent peptidase